MNKLFFITSVVATALSIHYEMYGWAILNGFVGIQVCYELAVDQGVARELRKRKNEN